MMSLMLDNNNNHNMMDQVNTDGFLLRSKITPSILGDLKVTRASHTCTSSSSSSSIGMNSDNDDDDDHDDKRDDCMRNSIKDDDDDDDDDDDEVESKLKISPFESAVDALEQALPMRRGISKFYSGKSKSFACLGDAACSSIKDITKAENAYTRKRKNLLAYSLLYDKGRTSPVKISGSIEKRSTSTNRSTLALAVAMKNCESTINGKDSSMELTGKRDQKISSPSPPSPPVPPPPWRSFSHADLQHCAVSSTSLNSNLCSLIGKKSKRDEVS